MALARIGSPDDVHAVAASRVPQQLTLADGFVRWRRIARQAADPPVARLCSPCLGYDEVGVAMKEAYGDAAARVARIVEGIRGTARVLRGRREQIGSVAGHPLRHEG